DTQHARLLRGGDLLVTRRQCLQDPKHGLFRDLAEQGRDQSASGAGTGMAPERRSEESEHRQNGRSPVPEGIQQGVGRSRILSERPEITDPVLKVLSEKVSELLQRLAGPTE